MKRRSLLQAMLFAALFPAVAVRAEQRMIEVYRNPACGCCEGWVRHLRDNGFAVKVNDVEDPGQYGAKSGVPEDLAGCHSALVDGYALEGHVPAREIRRLLAERPEAIGLAVPGMPLGAPGMESTRRESYDVLLINADGSSTVYSHYAGGVLA